MATEYIRRIYRFQARRIQEFLVDIEADSLEDAQRKFQNTLDWAIVPSSEWHHGTELGEYCGARKVAEEA